MKKISIFCLYMTLFTVSAFSQNLLSNPGFEGSTNLAPGWGNIAWGATYPVWNYTRETVNVHGGLSAQKITVTSMGSSNAGLIFKQNFTFKVGKVYEGSIYLRSDDSIKVQVYFRRSGQWYEPCATRTLEVGPEWQAVTIRGGFGDAADVPGFFGINFKEPGTITVDDASLTEIPRGDPQNAGVPIPSTLFGMHMNHYGAYTNENWPAVNFGILRLWDCGTRWNELEKSKGLWDWHLMDNLVNNAYNHGQDVIYTMGQTPKWASARPTQSTSYGPGSAAEPANIQDWRDYVHTVATRYIGKIKYYEIWNEWDQSNMSTISMAKMIELTRVAREELKAVDPGIMILSPNVTRGGFGKLDEFLLQGGGQYIDIISFHNYLLINPELSRGYHVSIQNLAENYGISNKPIWNTEGSGGSGAPDIQARGYVCRSFLTQWMDGISNFNWYCWDINNPLSLEPDHATWNASGYAYHETVKWMKGSIVTNRTINPDGTWIVSLTRANKTQAYILWNEKQDVPFSVPTEWDIALTRNLQGDSISGPVSSIALGLEPVLLENDLGLYIGNITLGSVKAGGDNMNKKYQGSATVLVLDKLGRPVSSANVSGAFTGDFNEIMTGVTDSTGQVTFVTEGIVKLKNKEKEDEDADDYTKKKSYLDFEFCVDSVFHESFIYEPEQNMLTCLESDINNPSYDSHNALKSAGIKPDNSKEKSFGLDNQANNELIVYPNPFQNGEVVIQFNGVIEADTYLSILNLSGQNVYRTEVTKSRMVLDRSNFIPGVFVIRIESKGQILGASKLVVQ